MWQDFMVLSEIAWLLQMYGKLPDHWYVATTGNDSTGNGSRELPFLTISAAITAASTGDTIHVSVLCGDQLASAAEIAQNLPDARETKIDGRDVAVTLRDGEAVLPEFIRRLHQSGIEAISARVVRPTLDDVFLGLTGRSLREAAA